MLNFTSELVFVPRKIVVDIPLREVRSHHIGKLVSIKAVIVRVTEVKPLLIVVTYTCENCGHEIYQEVLMDLIFSCCF